MQGISGKNVLVTGASSGIGRAIAIRFAQEGANVAINYYSDQQEALETQAAVQSLCQDMGKCGINSLVVQANVAQTEAVESMFDRVLQQFGRLDILINNAGMQIGGDSHTIELEAIDRMLEINLRGAYLCARRALQVFLSQGNGGIIINDSSVHELIPRPGYVGYSMSKSGLRGMTQTLALEYAQYGIRVNSIGPGATATPINNWANDANAQTKVATKIPLGRVGTPEEMAAVTVFLASEEAAYITGQTLFVDGGLTLYPSFREPWT